MCVYWRKYACSVHVWFKLLNSRAFVVYITKNYPYMFLYKLLSISFKWWICSEGVRTVTVDTHWFLLLCSRHTLQQQLCMVCYSRVINFNFFPLTLICLISRLVISFVIWKKKDWMTASIMITIDILFSPILIILLIAAIPSEVTCTHLKSLTK
jgi:hypothetical protein